LAGISIPNFVLGPLLVLMFALKVGTMPVSGWDGWMDRVLPAITLGALYAAYVARLTRGGMLEILSQDCIRTARAKGATPLRVILKHGMRGGLLPVVAFLGPAFAGLLSGSFVVEKVFNVPGIQGLVTAFNRDIRCCWAPACLICAHPAFRPDRRHRHHLMNPKLTFE
jgi:oligopeptide transport system permease protein